MLTEPRKSLGERAPAEAAAISVENLSRRFGKLEAVKGVSFAVHPGEIFGFLGPNGAVKSTTTSMLTTLLTPSGGRAEVAGHDVVRERNQVRQAIGIIFQEQALDLRLSALDNLWLHAILYGVPTARAAQRIEQGLRAVDLWDRRKEPVSRYSGGMKRRLEMARGLIHTPQVLFLDEPTVGLDPQSRYAMWDYIQRLRQEFGLTIFMTTHYMDEAEACDRIAIMDKGSVIALDSPAALKASLGGDVISLKTEHNGLALAELRERFGLEAKLAEDQLRLEVKDGGELLPRLLRELQVKILRVSLNQPTLDDVFVSLTGREMRDEGPADPRAMWMRRGR